MGQVVGKISNIKRVNLAAIQSGGSLANEILGADEVWLVDTTNSLTNSLSGNCDAYIEGDGHKIATALELKKINPEIDTLEDEVSRLSLDVDELGQYGDFEDYIKIVTDKENKLLYAIRADGEFIFGVGVPASIKQYIVDNYKSLGFSEVLDSADWMYAILDSSNKVVAGIDNTGKIYIGNFDDTTFANLKDRLLEDGAGLHSFSIPQLDANFSSPVPVTIVGDKGEPGAKYEFTLPLSNEFNIRFNFKITENLLNENKSAVIAKLGSTNVISAVPVGLTQVVSSATYNGASVTNYWGSLKGGIRINGSDVTRSDTDAGDQNIGGFAFCVKYIGSESTAYIQNDGEKIILTIGSVTVNYPFSVYQSVYQLYDAIRSRSDIEVGYCEIEGRSTSELAIFGNSQIKGSFYSGVNGGSVEEVQEYTDAAPFFLPYSVSERWHRAEIVRLGGTTYVVCDGVQQIVAESGNILSLGGECGVLFKDLDIHVDSPWDAEVAANGYIISSKNPYILIHEGHGIDKVPTEDGYVSDNMATSVDRLQYVYEYAISKGYIPVSIKDISDYYAGISELPKRCFTTIFDDYRFANCLDIENRAVFTRLGLKPALAIITDRNDTIYHNGEVITLQQAVDICRTNDFSLISHTRDHRRIINTKPSTYMQELTNDVYSADLAGVDGSILVYPYGSKNNYLLDTMRWLGYRCGVSIYEGTAARRNTYNRTRYRLIREEIGFRVSLSDIMSKII